MPCGCEFISLNLAGFLLDFLFIHYFLHFDSTSELKACFESLSENPDCRAIVLSGAGKYFTAGLDLKESLTWAQQLADIEDSARKGHFLEKKIKTYQVL